VHREDRFQPTAPNQAWSIDFVADQLQDGRRFRSLTVVDVFTRKAWPSKWARVYEEKTWSEA
jgi:putative transposase